LSSKKRDQQNLLQVINLRKRNVQKTRKDLSPQFEKLFLSFPIQWGGFISFFTSQLCTNTNSSASVVGGSLLPRLSEYLDITYAAYSSILRQIFCHQLVVASWSISEGKEHSLVSLNWVDGERSQLMLSSNYAKLLLWLGSATRVARWYVFEPKIQIWVNFGGPCRDQSCIFYGHLEYFTAIGIFHGHLVIQWQYGILCIPVLVY
jgi:hypothetical protein